jgi:putative solute:sodium symporter small subunit
MVAPKGLGWLADSVTLIGAALGVTFLFTIGVALLAPGLDRFAAFGVPTGFFLLVFASPAIMALAAGFFVVRQESIDRTYNVAGD